MQDTGTGGSWPISTDRTTWALGAERLLSALDGEEYNQFAERAYKAISNTLEADRLAALMRNPVYTLVSNHSSIGVSKRIQRGRQTMSMRLVAAKRYRQTWFTTARFSSRLSWQRSTIQPTRSNTPSGLHS